MPPVEIVLKDINSRTELARQLNVDVKAIEYISLRADTTCKSTSCNLLAANNNQNKCPLCRQGWFPTPPIYNDDGELKKKGKRGYGLYGSKFSHTVNGSSVQACCCENELCLALGYSHEGMFCPPSKYDDCKEAMRLLGIEDNNTKETISKTPSNYRIAPWHYHSFNLTKVDGKWKHRDRDKYQDKERQTKLPFNPPNANVQDYIDRIGSESARGAYDDTLPSWVKQLARLQINNSTTSATTATNNNNKPSNTPKVKGNKARKVVQHAPGAPRKPPRQSPETAENMALREHIRQLEDNAKILQAQLNSKLDEVEGLKATVELKDKEIIQIKFEMGELGEEMLHLKDKLETLEQRKGTISYEEAFIELSWQHIEDKIAILGSHYCLLHLYMNYISYEREK